MTQAPLCVFCRIVAGQLPSARIYEDDRVLAFMDINPITPGHSLVIVKAHRENLFEMDEEECVAAMRAAKKVSEAVRVTLKPDGLNLFQANGLVALPPRRAANSGAAATSMRAASVSSEPA